MTETDDTTLNPQQFGYQEVFRASSWNDFLTRVTGNNGK